MKLKTKVAIVAGASRGIGKGIAKALAAEGATVVVVARTEEGGGRLPGTIHETVSEIQETGGQAAAIKCDITNEEQVEAMVKSVIQTHGRIDVLVNNAAITLRTRIRDTETRHWNLMTRVNVLGPFLCCKHVVPIMEQQGSGSIINITSGGYGSQNIGGVHYSVSKACLDQLTYSLAEEVREAGVAVNSLNPGGVLTEGVRATRPADFDFSRYDPIESVGPPSIFLALQTASTITGQKYHRADFGNSWGK